MSLSCNTSLYRNTSQDCVPAQKISLPISPREDENFFSWLSFENAALSFEAGGPAEDTSGFNHNVLQRDGLHSQHSFVELVWRTGHLFDTIFKHYSIQIQSWNIYFNNPHPVKNSTVKTHTHASSTNSNLQP